MEYVKDDLKNTALPILIIKRDSQYKDYSQIGFGDEGSVHKYNDKIAFKTFDFFEDKEKLSRKFKKIELLGKIKDKSACFPIGLVGYEDEKKEGYYCELVHTSDKYRDFDWLLWLHGIKRKLKYIIEANEAIKRFHNMGIIIGDIKGDNILIDKNDNIKFVDTDNWKYGDYGYDLIPGRSKWLSKVYEKNFSELDNDRFVFAIMAMQLFLSGTVISHSLNDRYFEHMIKCLNVSEEAKEGLRVIFSDAINKPYIGDILKNANIQEEIISEKSIYELNRIRVLRKH